jgi:glycosyltransferase involved in cell wall biosynthesis
MRIVHILQGKANPETLNGVNKVVHWMATSQSRQGHDVEVWGLAASMTLPPHHREYNLRLFPMTRLRVTLGREIKAALANLEPGTWVHFHSVFIPEFPAIARLLKKRGFAYGATPHGAYALGVFKKNPLKKHIYFVLREAKYLRNAAWVQAIGPSEIQDILRVAPAAHVVLIPNGQERNLLEGVEVPQMASIHPVIGYCGRLSIRQKGLDFLIIGFSAYKSSGGRGKLWLIGDDVDRPAVERMVVEGGFKNDVRFFGTLIGVEKLKVIANFDVFIHSSRWEGLPMACLEAASLARPLVVSRGTNLAEYVERSGAGLVLDETSATGVERALQQVDRLYEGNQLQQMSRNALSLVEKEFSWEENARSFVAAVQGAKSAIQ